MNLRRTGATTGRVLRQLRHDPRTVALLLAVPAVLMGLLAWILNGRDGEFNRFGPPLLGIFPLIVMFLVTSVATLRERTNGTLERLLTMPLAKAEFVMGYALAFGFAAVIQAVVVSGLSFGLFGLHVSGSAWLLVLVARSRRVATEVTRNMTIRGKIPSRGGPNRLNSPSRPWRIQASNPMRTAGTANSIATVRGSCRSCRRTRPVVAPVRRRVMPTDPR